jgi:hypothetical protein
MVILPALTATWPAGVPPLIDRDGAFARRAHEFVSAQHGGEFRFNV